MYINVSNHITNLPIVSDVGSDCPISVREFFTRPLCVNKRYRRTKGKKYDAANR